MLHACKSHTACHLGALRGWGRVHEYAWSIIPRLPWRSWSRQQRLLCSRLWCNSRQLSKHHVRVCDCSWTRYPLQSRWNEEETEQKHSCCAEMPGATQTRTFSDLPQTSAGPCPRRSPRRSPSWTRRSEAERSWWRRPGGTPHSPCRGAPTPWENRNMCLNDLWKLNCK